MIKIIIQFKTDNILIVVDIITDNMWKNLQRHNQAEIIISIFDSLVMLVRPYYKLWNCLVFFKFCVVHLTVKRKRK